MEPGHRLLSRTRLTSMGAVRARLKAPSATPDCPLVADRRALPRNPMPRLRKLAAPPSPERRFLWSVWKH